MIDLHYWPTPNGWKVTIMLEECGLPYRTIPVDIGGGDQFKPEFLRISPNNRMPAIVDHEPLGGGAPLALFESGAILEYLADKTGRFLPRSGAARYATLQWVHWQMANLGPMMGNANHFKNYAKQLVDDPAQLAYGTRRFVGEVDRLCGVMDAQLAARRYLAGRRVHDRRHHHVAVGVPPRAAHRREDLDDVPEPEALGRRRWRAPRRREGPRPPPRVGRARRSPKRSRSARKEILFNQTNEKVRAAREAAAKAGAEERRTHATGPCSRRAPALVLLAAPAAALTPKQIDKGARKASQGLRQPVRFLASDGWPGARTEARARSARRSSWSSAWPRSPSRSARAKIPTCSRSFGSATSARTSSP